MSTDRDVTRIVQSWLEDGVTRLPDRILDDVLVQLPATRQRRTWWAAWRLLIMNHTFRLGVAAVSLIVIAVVGLTLFTGRNVAAPEPTATPSPTPVPFSSVSGSVEPGTYLVADNFPNITFSVPAEGWEKWGSSFSDGTGVLKECAERGAIPCAGFGFWYVENIYADLCESHLHGRVDPPIGPSAYDLARALANTPGRGVGPVPEVTISGYSGRYLEISVPVDRLNPLDPGACRQGRLWVAPDGGVRDVVGPGMQDRVWVLDVDGTRLVINAVTTPQMSEKDLAELEQIVESIEIHGED